MNRFLYLLASALASLNWRMSTLAVLTRCCGQDDRQDDMKVVDDMTVEDDMT